MITLTITEAQEIATQKGMNVFEWLDELIKEEIKKPVNTQTNAN